MRDLKNNLTTSGKGSKNIQSKKTKSFGYQVLGFGAGGAAAAFVTATGGTVTESGDYKIHTFTGPGTFCVSCAGEEAGSNSVSYIVVAGGGGGGAHIGGGAGAGGYREGKVPCSYTASPLAAACSALPVSVQGYPLDVGGGGAGAIYGPQVTGVIGVSSVFSSITSTGGGYGGIGGWPGGIVAGAGGSGGGGAGYTSPIMCGAAGNTPTVSPAQGFPGGDGSTAGGGCTQQGAGGGGATVVGTNACGPNSGGYAGPGGAGAGTAINPSSCVGTPGPCGSLRYFAGGGGGAAHTTNTVGAGGVGGGGAGTRCTPTPGVAGLVNTGGGGGSGAIPAGGGQGGSGVVIIRYKFQ